MGYLYRFRGKFNILLFPYLSIYLSIYLRIIVYDTVGVKVGSVFGQQYADNVFQQCLPHPSIENCAHCGTENSQEYVGAVRSLRVGDIETTGGVPCCV